MSLALNTKHLSSFINEEEYKAIYPQVEAAHKTLEAKNGPGSDFLGWMYLPRDYDKEEFERIKAAAAKIREDSDVLVVAGIGGSYLGARAVIEAVKGMYHNELDNGLKIYFCGNSISPTYLNDIIALCKGKRFSINVISKSGTTTETSLAFRVLRRLLEDEMGVEEANKRIYATTDRAKGTLKQLADAQGWPTFVVPDDVGGRYSVLSAVGLLPIAAAGISIDDVMKGAADAMERFSVLSPDNDAYKYAAIRNILYRKGKSIEILECYEPNFTLMNCTISISCATILDNMDACDPDKREQVPQDGVILAPVEVGFHTGENVFDVLQRVCRENRIQMESKWTPLYESAYIQGIHNLYEFDVGSGSGWMYSVNDWYPNYGCGVYFVKPGEVIEWNYTCDLGCDLENGDPYGYGKEWKDNHD